VVPKTASAREEAKKVGEIFLGTGDGQSCPPQEGRNVARAKRRGGNKAENLTKERALGKGPSPLTHGLSHGGALTGRKFLGKKTGRLERRGSMWRKISGKEHRIFLYAKRQGGIKRNGCTSWEK